MAFSSQEVARGDDEFSRRNRNESVVGPLSCGYLVRTRSNHRFHMNTPLANSSETVSRTPSRCPRHIAARDSAHHAMVRVSRSAEAIPLLVPNDALRRDEARAGAGPARGRRGAGEHSGSRNFLVATLLLCLAGAVMYAASSSLAADERADMRARINDARMVSRASFLPETLLSSTSASVNAELRTMTAEAGDLGAFADASAGTRADATPEPAVAFRTKGASCSCACCVGSACELEALTAALGARSGFGSDGDAEDAVSSAETTSPTSPSAVVRSFDAGSPAACDAEACRARFAEACPKHASAGIVSARFHAESAPGADGASARGAFESFETSMVGAVFDETAFEDVYAPPSADDIRRAEEWVRDAISEARAAEAAIENTVGEVAESSGLTPEQIEESAARAEAEQAAQDAAEAAATEQNPAEAPEEAVADAPEEAAAEAPEEAAAEAPEEAAAEAPEEAAAEAAEEAAAEAPEEAAAEAPDASVVAEEDSASASASPSPSNVSAAARLGWIVDGTHSGAFRRDTEAPLGQEETEDAPSRDALVWDAVRAANDAAARGDDDALRAIFDDLEKALAVDLVNDATGETERFAPQLNGGVPHYVDADVSRGGGEVEAFVAPVVATAATLGGTVPDPDRPDLWAPRAAEDAEEGAAEEGSAEGVSAETSAAAEGDSAETSAAAEGDSAENAPPVTTRREFVPLHAEHDPSAPWRAPVALVIAHYDEWDDLDEMPVWANNSKDPRVHPDAPTARGYTVAPMYQRRRPESPGYVPNHGYEGGVYLRFVLDHYDNLPDVAVFVQADADKIGDVPSRLGKVVTRQKERGDVGYLPINVGWDGNFEQVYFHKRDPYQEWWSETSLRDVDKCWRTVAGLWGHEWPSETVPTVSGYCCNYFAASRESIRATPLATWRKAYETLIERGECSPGAGPVATRTDDKWQIAIALEHMAHVMFGGHFPHYPRHCGEARVGASNENENENENAFLDAPVMGTFPDACCGGDACGAKGAFYAEDTDWTADEPDFESGAPPRLEPPDLGKGEDQIAWAALGHTAQARDDALVGLAALSGMSPYSDADPAVRSVEFKRAALAAAREDVAKLGDDEDAWRVAIEAGASVKGLARAYAAAKAAARAAGAAAAE